MRKLLTSSNAAMVAVLIVLVAVGLWVIVGPEETEPQQTEKPAAVGGGPNETVDEQAPTDGESATEDGEAQDNLEQPDLEQDDPAGPPPATGLIDPSELARPESADVVESVEDDEAVDEVDEEVDQETSDVDQEEAYRSDEAPEAEVLATEPPEDDQQARGGGGPLDEPNEEAESDPDDEELDRAADEAAAEIDGRTDQPQDEAKTPDDTPVEGEEGGDGETRPQRVQDLMNDLEREEGGVERPQGDSQPPQPPDQPTSDDSLIERPSLRTAPEPERPGE